MRKVKKVLISVMALLVVFAVVPVMAAPATKTPFAAASFVPRSVSLGKGWITEGGIQQVKGAISEGDVTGDISGSMWIASYETVNLNTGKGNNHGKFVLTVDGGTFEGSFRSVVRPLGFSCTFAGQGTGICRGLKIMGSHEGVLTVVDTTPVVIMTLEGIILSQHG